MELDAIVGMNVKAGGGEGWARVSARGSQIRVFLSELILIQFKLPSEFGP
jgi:hypothetical protein